MIGQKEHNKPADHYAGTGAPSHLARIKSKWLMVAGDLVIWSSTNFESQADIFFV